MTESTEPTAPASERTVRQYRHQIRGMVRALPLPRIDGILAGVPGLSQAQQVERLDKAIGALRETGDALGAVRGVAVEARDYAATRDFAAHQAAKGRPVPSEDAEVDNDEAVVNPENTEF